MRIDLDDILPETLTVFYHTDARDAGESSDVWESRQLTGQWSSKIESTTGDGTLSKTKVFKLHLDPTDYHEYADYLTDGGWTLRPGDYVVRGEASADTVAEIKALSPLCEVQAVTPNTGSGWANGNQSLRWLNSVYAEGF